MFVKKNVNRRSTSVQIISKQDGKYRVIQTLGTTKDPGEIERLEIEARDRINYPPDQPTLFSILSKTDIAIRDFLTNISNLQIHVI